MRGVEGWGSDDVDEEDGGIVYPNVVRSGQVIQDPDPDRGGQSEFKKKLELKSGIRSRKHVEA